MTRGRSRKVSESKQHDMTHVCDVESSRGCIYTERGGGGHVLWVCVVYVPVGRCGGVGCRDERRSAKRSEATRSRPVGTEGRDQPIAKKQRGNVHWRGVGFGWVFAFPFPFLRDESLLPGSACVRSGLESIRLDSIKHRTSRSPIKCDSFQLKGMGPPNLGASYESLAQGEPLPGAPRRRRRRLSSAKRRPGRFRLLG